MATQLDPTIFGYQNFYSALLTADITSGSLTISLDTVPSPTAGILIIDPDSTTSREIILYTSKGASTVTCPSDGRGWGGSTAAAHLTGTTVIMAPIKEFFSGLADGTLSTDPIRSTLFGNHVISGGVVAQSAGLVGTFSNIVFYLNGQRYSGTSIANKTYTASKDTYVDITAASGGAVSVTYTEVANGATAPALSANYLRIAKVVTSGVAITSVTQNPSSDGIGNPFRNIGPSPATNNFNPYKFSVYLAANQTGVTDATITKILFDTKNFDTGNNVDITTNKGRFTAPVAGFYQIQTVIGVNPASGSVGVSGLLSIYKNNVEIRRVDLGYPSTGNTAGVFGGAFSEVLQLNAGDYIEVAGYADVTSGTVSFRGGTTGCVFSGYLVSAL